MNSVTHLTEEQIDDHLIGDSPDDLIAHLSDCELCQARVAEVEGAIRSFKDVTLAWCERQSATMPVRVHGMKSAASQGARTVWATAAAAALLIAVAVPVVHREAGTRAEANAIEQPASASQSFALEREAQIAEDNQMMQAIDREISSSVSSPSETFGLQLGGDSQRIAHTASVED